MASLSPMPMPNPFNFSKSEEWPKWRRRFEQYRFASGLSEESGARQCSALLYCLGDASEDILNISGIADRDRTKYNAVLAKLFDAHFAIRKNLIYVCYERAIFNKRKQEKGESIELYIADVHCSPISPLKRQKS